MVSQICTLWPLRFHQECFIFGLMQPECPNIPSFAHCDESFFSLMQPVCPDGSPPTAGGCPPHFVTEKNILSTKE